MAKKGAALSSGGDAESGIMGYLKAPYKIFMDFFDQCQSIGDYVVFCTMTAMLCYITAGVGVMACEMLICPGAELSKTVLSILSLEWIVGDPGPWGFKTLGALSGGLIAVLGVVWLLDWFMGPSSTISKK